MVDGQQQKNSRVTTTAQGLHLQIGKTAGLLCAMHRLSMAAASKQALVAAAALAVAAVLAAAPAAFAADILVGDAQGWRPNFDYDKWVDGNEFVVNDTLVFRYAKGQHSVVQATEGSFAACSQANSLGVWTSGDDRVALSKSGQWWFLSGVSDDCSQGMRFNVTVLPEVKLSSPAPPARAQGGGVAAAVLAAAGAAAALLFC